MLHEFGRPLVPPRETDVRYNSLTAARFEALYFCACESDACIAMRVLVWALCCVSMDLVDLIWH